MFAYPTFFCTTSVTHFTLFNYPVIPQHFHRQPSQKRMLKVMKFFTRNYVNILKFIIQATIQNLQQLCIVLKEFVLKHLKYHDYDHHYQDLTFNLNRCSTCSQIVSLWNRVQIMQPTCMTSSQWWILVSFTSISNSIANHLA